MNFSQYMSAGQGGITPGGIEDPNIICYEDGTCGPGYPQVGQSQDPSGWSIPPRVHKIYGDGTGGHFITTANHVAPTQYVASIEGTGGPQPVGPPAASPRPGLDFAQLLNIMRMERGLRRRPEQRNRGVE